MNTTLRLPDTLAHDIDQHELDVHRFLSGEISASILKSRRVPRGIYEQRQDGTFMVRVRLPGGTLSSAQARALAGVVAQHGSETLHVTTRQDIQIHDVSIDQTPVVLRELMAAGLTSNGGGGNTVRNVTACPYAGICPAERFDVTPCVMAVTEYLIGLPGSYNLPRKYKIAFSGCRADCALAQVNDLGFIADARDGQPGFIVYAGGGMGAESRVGDRMEEWVPATEVIRIAEAGRRLFDRLGDRKNRRRARLRFAVERLGADAFRGMLRDAVLAATADGVPASEAVPECAGGPLEPPDTVHDLFTPASGFGVLRQRQPGLVAVQVPLPLGQISGATLVALADLAERFSEETMLRATRNQKLLLRFVRRDDLDTLRNELERTIGADARLPGALDSFTACTGAATCRLGLCLPRGAALACAEALTVAGIDPATLRAVDIRMNGCPNACAQHPVGMIGLFGVAQRTGGRLVPAYRVLLGARHAEGHARLGESVGEVPARLLPGFFVGLLRDFQTQRSSDESFPDYVDRRGMPHFGALLARHADTPGATEDPAFYRDWGQDADFSLAGRGPGECGAGVFEVIAEDLSAAAKALGSSGTDADSPATLFQGLLATCRALLITRGIDSQDPDQVLRWFETHFVDTGMIDPGFRGLLSRARGHREGWLEALVGHGDEIRRLLERVEYLYSTMDAELRFHAHEEASAPTAPVTSPDTPGAGTDTTAPTLIDLRGVACPMNFVKAKLRMETLEVGATLAVLLDDGEPVRNVPASFRNEGQDVVETHALEGGRHWRVLIRKSKS